MTYYKHIEFVDLKHLDWEKGKVRVVKQFLKFTREKFHEYDEKLHLFYDLRDFRRNVFNKHIDLSSRAKKMYLYQCSADKKSMIERAKKIKEIKKELQQIYRAFCTYYFKVFNEKISVSFEVIYKINNKIYTIKQLFNKKMYPYN